MFQALSELINYFIYQVIEESEKVNNFNIESRPLVCANFMRLYSALCYVERYSQELIAELKRITKGETSLIKAVIRSKNKKLFASIENLNSQLLRLEYLGDHHINLLREERKPKAVWQYPDEWCINVQGWIARNIKDCIRKHDYAIYPFILTSPFTELNKQIAVLRYPTKIPNASVTEDIIARLSAEIVDLKLHSPNTLTFGQQVSRGANGAYQHILSGEWSYRLLMQLLYDLLGIQEIDLNSMELLESLLGSTQAEVNSISNSRHALSYFISHSLQSVVEIDAKCC